MIRSALLATLLAAPVAQDRAKDEGDIIVTAKALDIIVTGRLLRCVRRPGDPIDAVDLTRAPRGTQMMVARDEASGRFALARDTDPIGGDDWQRAGTAMQDYVFRAPVDGTPLCIGARGRATRGMAQLRRIVDAKPFRSRGVRFSGYVLSSRSGAVRFWLAAGREARGVIAGNSTSTARLDHCKGWKTFVFEIPYVPPRAWSISYGFLLDGPGDVWVDQPRLEPLPFRGRDQQLRGSRL